MDVGTQPGSNRLEFSEAWKSIAPMPLRWKQPHGQLPPIIVTMSFNRLFLGRLLSSRARLRFTGFGYSATQFPVGEIGWEPSFNQKGTLLMW
jgi:hypothetical protein